MIARQTLGALALAFAATTASAHGGHGDGPDPAVGMWGDGSDMMPMMQMMMRMHGGMPGGIGPGPGMMGDGRPGPGMMHGGMPGFGDMDMMGRGIPAPGGMGMMGGGFAGPMMRALDADGDGAVSPEEAASSLQSLLDDYDADGDGTLSIGEFEALHGALIRETMVDRFQYLDSDGDGRVTQDEITAPVDRMSRAADRRDRMMEEFGNGPMMPRDGGMMDGDREQTHRN